MTEPEFQRWLQEAPLGERITYCVDDPLAERGRRLHADMMKILARRASDAGVVMLFMVPLRRDTAVRLWALQAVKVTPKLKQRVEEAARGWD